MRSLLKPKFLLYSIMMLLYGIILLVVKPQEPAVFFLWIVSLTMIVLRLRFQWMSRLIWLDLLFYLVWMIFDQQALLFMLPSLTLLLYEGKMIYLLLYIVLYGFFELSNLNTLFILLIATIGGLLLNGWSQDRIKTTHTIDALRESVYQSEIEREHLLQDQHELSRLSVLSERDRIAQKLHDDLGHELTGALLALRAFESIHKETINDQSFQALKTRLQKSVESLKTTVHHTRPEEDYGLERFKQFIDQINLCKVDYDQKGIIKQINAAQWQLLISILKEAITNIQKHARPKEIQIKLHVQASVIRLSIANDGIKDNKESHGVGLRYMRKRVEAMNGSLSIQKTMIFTLLVILPLNMKEGV
jgi:signal transduction histidine kinase